VGEGLEYCFNVETSEPLDAGERVKLEGLLRETFEPEKFGRESLLGLELEQVVEFGSRTTSETPWATTAVAICHACGLTKVTRVEFSRRHMLPVGASESQFIAAHPDYDRMTMQVYPEPLTTLAPRGEAEPVRTIPLIEEGIPALERFAQEKGLALWPVMMEYIYDYFVRKLSRNPTDVETFKFGQLNSEHCRHPLFNALFIIDGQPMPETLLGMIRSTVENNRGNVAVAFEDNAAILLPSVVTAFMPESATGPSAFITRTVDRSIVMKVETHNHPTTISPYPGAATGVAVRRDIFGSGRGAVPVAHVACYYVANLLIPGYDLPWEREYAPHPSRFATPLDIIIQASNGASDDCNCFGNPVILGSYTSFEEMVGQDHYGWKKTAMVAGSWGYMDARHIQKEAPKKGMKVVQIGGDAHPIGVGGGSGSSQFAGGQDADLDFNSVQRADPLMEKSNFDVFRGCSELGSENPIANTTDLGAGGDCVAVPELVYPAGARVELRQVPCGDTSMPVYVFWCNESQERMVLLIWPEKLELFLAICERHRCPVAVIGEVTGDGKFVLTDSQAAEDSGREQKVPIDVDMDFLLADLPQVTVDVKRVERQLKPAEIPDVPILTLLDRVLRLPKVGSKAFLTRQADRSVGGLVAQQQTVGPLQLTLADCAVTAMSFPDITGSAIALGEQPIVGLVDTQAGGRMSLGESLTNLVWALVNGFESINFSGTWQWPCKQPGEDARLYETVRAVTELCKQLGLRIPVGKDSVSMSALTELLSQPHFVRSPGTVQIISFADCLDITKTVTPDLKAPGESRLMFIDLAKGKQRLGGSALLQVHNQVGNEAPDVEDAGLLRRAFEAVQRLIQRELILAGHDRSDGGLITCLLEMAFAGNCGLDLNFRRSAGFGLDPRRALFNQELGWVIEYQPEDHEKIRGVLGRADLARYCHVLGQGVEGSSAGISVRFNGEEVLGAPMPDLRAIWQETSCQHDAIQANPEVVAEEKRNCFIRPGPGYKLSFNPRPTPKRVLSRRHKPRAAILCEKGTNGEREMAGASRWAGFDPKYIVVTDLIEGRASLKGFKALALPGGFTFSDVFGAGKAMAGVIELNQRVADEFSTFRALVDTCILGVCNGCQVMPLLGIVPWEGIPIEKRPRFIRNVSRIFESRPITVGIGESNSIFLQDMAGSVMGVWVAHGEGQFYCPDKTVLDQILSQGLAPIRYVDDYGAVTEEYPFNPNGSPFGIAGISSPDGRFLAMMPHPERLFQLWQWPWMPKEWKTLKASPWMRLFQNAREWCDQS